MKIDDSTIEYVAALAKLTLTGAERKNVKNDMEKILDYMETMNGLDTDGVEPMSHPFPRANVFREDEAVDSFDRENLLENAPAQKDGCFVVPKTVE